MALENLIAFALVFGLPIWLAVEEIVYRLPAGPRTKAAASTRVRTSATDPVGLGRRAPEGVRAL